MALTATQKSQIRLYLGYEDRSQGANYSLLEGVMDDLSAEAETQVGTLLTNLAAIETALAGSVSRQKVIKAEEVTLAGPQEVRTLWRMGNRLARNLATLLGVEVARIPFSSGPASGVARRG